MSTKESWRLGMRRLAAGVCVISTQVDGRQYAMTVSSVTSVSDEPASLLVCVNKEANIQPFLKLGQRFVVNVLSSTQQDISTLCAAPNNGDERFAQGGWEEDDNRMPFLVNAQVNFFCCVDNDNYCYGTHQIVIARLQQVRLLDSDIDPLVYVDGRYASVS